VSRLRAVAHLEWLPNLESFEVAPGWHSQSRGSPQITRKGTIELEAKMTERPQTQLTAMSTGERGRSSGSLKSTSSEVAVAAAAASSGSSGIKKGLKGIGKKLKKKGGDKTPSFTISGPTNFEQRTHINSELEWSTESPEDAFTLHEQLGEGYPTC